MRVGRWLLGVVLAGGLVALGWWLRVWTEPIIRMERPAAVQTFEWTEPRLRPLREGLVDPSRLLQVLPSGWPGWQPQEPPYAKRFQHQDYAYTMAGGIWERDGAQVEVRVMDVRHATWLGENLRSAVAFQEETLDHFRRGIEGPDYYGFEAFYYKQRRGEIHLMVADRFWVTVEGYGVDSIEVLRDALQRVNIAMLRRWASL